MDIERVSLEAAHFLATKLQDPDRSILWSKWTLILVVAVHSHRASCPSMSGQLFDMGLTITRKKKQKKKKIKEMFLPWGSTLLH